jgi:hypothetical protein
MAQEETEAGFRIWAVDNVVYGPVELPTLVGWVKEKRVTGETWVFSEKDDCWRKAKSVPELLMFFSARASKKPSSLRRVKIFAQFTDTQLERFVRFMEVLRVRQFAEVVKQGVHGDAMYFVLEGELRVSLMVSGKETILVTLSPGEFFGEISLFDQGPRSADVVANKDSLLLKISAESFQNLLENAPDLAAPFLFGMSKTLTARIRADNKRYRDSISFARAAGRS